MKRPKRIGYEPRMQKKRHSPEAVLQMHYAGYFYRNGCVDGGSAKTA